MFWNNNHLKCVVFFVVKKANSFACLQTYLVRHAYISNPKSLYLIMYSAIRTQVLGLKLSVVSVPKLVFLWLSVLGINLAYGLTLK